MTDPQRETDKPMLYTGEIAEFGEISVIDKLASIIEGLLGKSWRVKRNDLDEYVVSLF